MCSGIEDLFFFFKQKTAYEMRISDWSSDVCSSDLLVAQHAVLRQMSLSVSGMLQQGEDPAIEAAVVKDIGNGLEQRVPEVVRELLDAPTPGTSGADIDRLLSFQLQAAPSFSLRGGTDRKSVV